jgi:hypothetical protein
VSKTVTKVELIEVFGEGSTDYVNDFIIDKDVVDIKMNTIVHDNYDDVTTRYLVIYREESR